MGEKEVSNLAMALKITEILDKDLIYELVDFHSQRPGHDLRYALNGDKLKNEWKYNFPKTFEDSLKKTIQWYLKEENKRWLELTSNEAVLESVT